MYKTSTWHSKPVFISSTFRDMQAERDHLRDIVFPELERRMNLRQCHLEPVDLRWGVETVSASSQEQKELLVLKVCLDEIERWCYERETRFRVDWKRRYLRDKKLKLYWCTKLTKRPRIFRTTDTPFALNCKMFDGPGPF